MIYGVTAQTGGGKSYFAMKKIAEYLWSRPKDHVVTNLAIDMQKLTEYLFREHGEMLDVSERVRILTLDEVGMFFLYYGVGYDIDPAQRIEIREGDGKIHRCIDYGNRSPGKAEHSVLYVIDEADEIFSAKNFAAMVTDLKYYARHQRKFGDDVYLISPAWEFLVKELRIMCHGVWVMENGAQMKMGKIPVIGTMFRGVSWIKGTQWKVKQGGAWGGMNETPRDTTRFKVDPNGIGSCYRTEDGLGVKGIAATVRRAEKAKGLSPMWIGVAVGVFILLLFLVPRMLGKAFASSVTSVSKVTTNSISYATEQTAVSASKTNFVPMKAATVEKEVEDYLTGIVSIPVKGLPLRAYLASGRTISSGPGVQFIRDATGRYGAVVEDGKAYTFNRKTL